MSNIDKQALADDESVKTYYIHPAAFGCTKNPGYRHVPVVHADDFEKQRAKLEAAEKRIAELEAREVKLPPTLWYEHDDLPREIPVLSRRLVINALREAGVKVAAGIGVKGE